MTFAFSDQCNALHHPSTKKKSGNDNQCTGQDSRQEPHPQIRSNTASVKWLGVSELNTSIK